MHQNNHKFKAPALALALLLGCTTAGAATFEYSGVVELCPTNVIPCINGSIGVGDSLTGMIIVDDSALLPDSPFYYDAVTDFDFILGNFAFTPLNADVVDGIVTTGRTGEIVDGFLYFYSPDLGGGAPPTYLILDLTTSTWMLLASIPNLDWPFVAATGTGSFSQVIPLPGSIALLLPALGLLAMRRTQQRTRG